VAYEYPWDPATDPQRFHLYDKSGERIDCEHGKLTPECYKERWHESDPTVVKNNKAPWNEVAKPRVRSTGTNRDNVPKRTNDEDVPQGVAAESPASLPGQHEHQPEAGGGKTKERPHESARADGIDKGQEEESDSMHQGSTPGARPDSTRTTGGKTAGPEAGAQTRYPKLEPKLGSISE
jgi:hypothetical protein